MSSMASISQDFALKITCFMICRDFNNAYFMELLAGDFSLLPEFSNKINARCYSIVEICSIANQNIDG